MPKVMPNGAAGHGGGGGRRRRPRVSSALSEINVVPLVDVMLVPAADPIYVSVPAAFGRNGLVLIGKESIRLEVLAERIRQRVQQREDKQVFLHSDGEVTMQHIMDVMDRLKDGGVDKVGIVSRPLTDRR
jgi:biopolymer transport protein ExbD